MTTNTFNSQSNKSLLWRCMYENNMFANLDNSLSVEIQKHFEGKIQQMDKRKTQGDTLISLNKQIINEMLSDIKDIKTKFNMTLLNNIQENKINPMITAQEITQNRQKTFDKQLKTMQNEFDSLMHAPKPEIIDFADKPLSLASPVALDDTSLNSSSEIERLLAETIAKRENMLFTINETDKTKAANWVNNQRDIKSIQEKTKQLKIGADTELIFLEENDTKNTIMKKKSVSFNDELLQFTPINKEDTILEKTLKEINEKLSKVIELLTPKEQN